MPCGGIYRIRSEGFDRIAHCFHCNKEIAPGGPLYFVEEWDAHVHGKCIHAFLLTDEGRIVLQHGHVIAIDEGGGAPDDELAAAPQPTREALVAEVGRLKAALDKLCRWYEERSMILRAGGRQAVAEARAALVPRPDAPSSEGK